MKSGYKTLYNDDLNLYVSASIDMTGRKFTTMLIVLISRGQAYGQF